MKHQMGHAARVEWGFAWRQLSASHSTQCAGMRQSVSPQRFAAQWFHRLSPFVCAPSRGEPQTQLSNFMSFETLGLLPALLTAVREQGYDTPTPIQQQAIPIVLTGADLLAGAQTGTGKTAAFTLPLLHRLATQPSARSRLGGVGTRALVLTPTRELAAQVEESVRLYGKHLQLRSTVIFGGVGMKSQVDALRKGVDIVVATPGRLLDLNEQGFLDLSTVKTFILDEADRMLDMGFIHDVRKVLAMLPKEKQSLLFSATFSDDIRDLANTLLKAPQHIHVTPRNTTVQRITQSIHPVGRHKKTDLLMHVVRSNNWSQVLAFTRTKHTANEVALALAQAGISSMALHGNKSQAARTQALSEFKSGKLRVLVATDIAARGIDIEDLPHVVNYDIPNVSEDYVHRIGRTGRAGKEGVAVSFVCADEGGWMQDIERFTKQRIPVVVVPGFDAPNETGEPMAMGRQVIWGGLGKPPSREVMAAAGKAARREMMQRVNERKDREAHGGRGDGRSAARPAHNGAPARPGTAPAKTAPASPRPNPRPNHARPAQNANNGPRRDGGRSNRAGGTVARPSTPR